MVISISTTYVPHLRIAQVFPLPQRDHPNRKWFKYRFHISPQQGHHPKWKDNQSEQAADANGIDLWMTSALGNIAGQFVQF